MYGIGAVKYKNKKVGYIAKNSFDMGGTKPESAEIDAEQVPGAPVLVIPQSNGKIGPKFDMIQLNFESLQLTQVRHDPVEFRESSTAPWRFSP